MARGTFFATKAGSHFARSQQALGAMRYPEFRKYWVATLAAVVGTQMVMFSQLWLVRQLDADPIWLGAIGLAAGVPAIVLNFVGGAVADRIDQRRLVMMTQIISAGLIVLLATLTFWDVVRVWHILAIAFCNGGVQAFSMPAQQAIFPRLIPRDHLVNAVALNSSIWQSTRMVAPMLSGLVIAAFGTDTALYAGSAGFLASAILLTRLKVPPVTGTRTGSALQELFEGARYVRHNSLFASLIGTTFFNSFFGMAYLQLLPIFTVDVLHKGASAQGALASAGGLGALLGTLTTALLGRFPHRGWLILGGSVLFGGFIAGFGLSHWYSLSIGFLFLAGFSQSVYMISVMSTLQMRVPDQLRGRVMGIYGMTYNLMPLGGMVAGAVASVVSAPFAIASGAAAVCGFAVTNGSLNRQVRHLTSEARPDKPVLVQTVRG